MALKVMSSDSITFTPPISTKILRYQKRYYLSLPSRIKKYPLEYIKKVFFEKLKNLS